MAKNKTQQLEFKRVKGWGGKRRGAGRPNKSGQVSHGKRTTVKASTPLHLTWRLKGDLVNLRCGEVKAAFEKGAEGAKKFGLRVVQFSILSNHVHLFVECADNSSLERGMRSFGCRFGKAIRKITGGRGEVFDGRYDLHVLTNPTETKRALGYVLQNFANHSKLLKHIDGYSSAPYFSAWRALFGNRAGPILNDVKKVPPLPKHLSAPRSWLGREGWMRGDT